MPSKTAQNGLFGDDLLENADSMGVSGRTPVAQAPQTPAIHVLAERLPERLYLGTSSWFFPGWAGLVYDRKASEAVLGKTGLQAYGKHPLLRSVGIDRTFYAPIGEEDFARYAAQVPPQFRFLVKAPAAVTDAFKRDSQGRSMAPNPGFFDAAWTREQFILPALRGLRAKAGPLVFQFSPVGRGYTDDPGRFAEKLEAFLAQLPREAEGCKPLYAVEVRDAALLTPMLAQALKTHGATYCVGLHASMPRLAAQLPMLRALWPTPLVVRWSLNQSQGRALRYEAAKSRYEPFDKLIDEDPETRHALADLAGKVIGAKQDAYIIANNKAEGSAPLTLLKLLEAMLGDEGSASQGANRQ
jgi:uncharacterized protein YecE (DUF72 family)